MKSGVTETVLIQRFEDEGITVLETDAGMGDGEVAWYSRSARTVAIRPGLLERQRVPALLHEYFHHCRGDDGPQPAWVEARIDEEVAELLVDPRAYAEAEERFGWSTGGIAHALEVPRWVVEAYRRVLVKSGGVSHL